jgi:hypothetical protein
MTGLNATMLAKMRTQFVNFLPDTCTIERATRTPDGAGGWSETWTLVSGGTVKCRLDPLYTRDQVETVGAKEGFVSEYLLTVPYDAPLESSYRVVLNGDTYQVRMLLADHSWRVARRAYIARVE